MTHARPYERLLVVARGVGVNVLSALPVDPPDLVLVGVPPHAGHVPIDANSQGAVG